MTTTTNKKQEVITPMSDSDLERAIREGRKIRAIIGLLEDPMDVLPLTSVVRKVTNHYTGEEVIDERTGEGREVTADTFARDMGTIIDLFEQTRGAHIYRPGKGLLLNSSVIVYSSLSEEDPLYEGIKSRLQRAG